MTTKTISDLIEKTTVLDDDVMLIEGKSATNKVTKANFLKEVISQIKDKAGKNEVFSMANMGQDIKEAMTGGSVAVVGVDTVLTNNIVDKQVSPIKTTFINVDKSKNLFNKDDKDIVQNHYIGSNGTHISSPGYYITHKINVKVGQSYTMRYAELNFGAFYKSDGTFLQKIGTNGGTAKPFTFTVPEKAAYMRLNGRAEYKATDMVVLGNTYPTEFIPFYENKTLNDDIKINSIIELESNVNDLNIDVDILNSNFANSINLYNKLNDENLDGYFCQSSSDEIGVKLTALSGVQVTHCIPVSQGKSYTALFRSGTFGSNTMSMLCNKNKKAIGSLSGVLDSTSKHVTYTIPNNSDIKYIRIHFSLSEINKFMVVEGTEYPDEYSPYMKTLSKDIGLNDTQEQSINNMIENETKDFISFTNDCSVNLLDLNKTIVGFLNGAGNLNINDGYITSDYIEVNNGDTVRYGFSSSMGGNIYLYLYDKNKEFLASTPSPTKSDDGRYWTIEINNTKAKYFRCSLATKDNNTYMVTINNDYPKEFEKYRKYKYIDDFNFREEQIKEISNFVKDEISEELGNTLDNPLYHKIVAFNGDSICAGAGFKGGFGKIIADRNDMIYENIGVGGGTITAETYSSSDSARHWISRTVSRMRADADYIILEGGVNDASLNIPLGTITSGYSDSLDDTTYCGAFESMLKQALERFKGKKIGYIFVHKMAKNYDSRYENNHYQMSKKICEKWGVPYIDLNVECPPLNYIPSLRTAYTSNGDGWHPNEEGYKKYYCDKIESWMKTL